MRLYFTGASDFLLSQSDANRSLGGMISSSPLPNGTLDEILGAISEKQMSDGLRETKAFALLNDTGADINTSKLFYENNSGDPISNIRMSIVQVGEDIRCGTFYMEQIANGSQSPLHAQFKDNRGESNSIIMPNIPNGGYLGVWVERSINKKRAGSGPGGLMSCDSMYSRFNSESSNQIQEVVTVGSFILNSLGGKYFTIDTTEGRYYIWYNTGVPQDPLVAGREGIEVNILDGDVDSVVASKTYAQLKSILENRGDILISINLSVITIENQSPGLVPAINISASGFQSNMIAQGVSSELETEEEISLFIKY